LFSSSINSLLITVVEKVLHCIYLFGSLIIDLGQSETRGEISRLVVRPEDRFAPRSLIDPAQLVGWLVR
jgi:hypothetical protein